MQSAMTLNYCHARTTMLWSVENPRISVGAFYFLFFFVAAIWLRAISFFGFYREAFLSIFFAFKDSFLLPCCCQPDGRYRTSKTPRPTTMVSFIDDGAWQSPASRFFITWLRPNETNPLDTPLCYYLFRPLKLSRSTIETQVLDLLLSFPLLTRLGDHSVSQKGPSRFVFFFISLFFCSTSPPYDVAA